MEPRTLHILHFNDAYDITKASQFVQKAKMLSSAHTLNIFSGDIFFPSLESTFNGGYHMVKVMTTLEVDYAIPGNHDVDKGEDHFIKLIEPLKTKWLLSNYKSETTGINIANCADYDIVQVNGIKVGLLGVIDLNWIETADMDCNGYILEDFMEKAKNISKYLKAQNCDIIIAITHMKNFDDEHLITGDNDIDIVLGGHDHVYMVKRDKGKVLVKSGSNFESLSNIKLYLSHIPFQEQSRNPQEPDTDFFYFLKRQNNNFDNEYRFSLERPNGYLNVQIEPITITPDDPRSQIIDELIAEVSEALDQKIHVPLCQLVNELDTRSSAIRLKENALANLIADIVKYELNVDAVLLSGGHIRSDALYPMGHIITVADVCAMFPWRSCFCISEVTGLDIKIILEQSYRGLPSAAGSFLHLSGLKIIVDASKPQMERISIDDIYINGESIVADKVYRLAALAFITLGKDGFTHFNNVKVIGLEDKKLSAFEVLVNYLTKDCDKSMIMADQEKPINGSDITDENGLACNLCVEENSETNKQGSDGTIDDEEKFDVFKQLHDRYVKGRVKIGSHVVYLLDLYTDGRMKIIGLNN